MKKEEIKAEHITRSLLIIIVVLGFFTFIAIQQPVIESHLRNKPIEQGSLYSVFSFISIVNIFNPFNFLNLHSDPLGPIINPCEYAPSLCEDPITDPCLLDPENCLEPIPDRCIDDPTCTDAPVITDPPLDEPIGLDECTTDADCGEGFECVNNFCAVIGGPTPADPLEPAGPYRECEADSDCSEFQICHDFGTGDTFCIDPADLTPEELEMPEEPPIEEPGPPDYPYP